MASRWILAIVLIFLSACQKHETVKKEGQAEHVSANQATHSKQVHSSLKPDTGPALSQQADNATESREHAMKQYPVLQKPDQEDPRLWLEEVSGEKALQQVRSWNSKTLNELQNDPNYEESYNSVIQILNDKERLVYGSYHNGWVWNFWQDAKTHIRGVYRRARLEDYLSESPKWEILIDIDDLAKQENKNWVYKGLDCFSKDNKPLSNCLLYLSDGGKDASYVREFNLNTKEFIEGGFKLDEAKSNVDWRDRDTLWVATDFGPDSLTQSGYPRILKLWKRGRPFSEAVKVYEGKKTDMSVSAFTMHREQEKKPALSFIVNYHTFYEKEYFWVKDINHPVKLPLPLKSSLSGLYKGQMLIDLMEDWRGFKKGTLLSFPIDEFLETGEIKSLNLVYVPHDRSFVDRKNITQSGVLMSIYENVKGALYRFDFIDGNWSSEKVLSSETGENLSVFSSSEYEDIVFLSMNGFLKPTQLWALNVSETQKNNEDHNNPLKIIDQAKSWFKTDPYRVDQYEAVSKDGTKIPYFIIHKKDMALDGKNPVLLYGYGGFEIPLLPGYSASLGKLWLDKGGVYVLANIRGGGEFGPQWHQAGLKTKRQVIYDDFIAIAEKLIDDKITSPDKLAIQGGSNGGLLMGVMYTQRPELWGAIICAVPLLDMLRYHTLLAGASWMGEYGNPDIKEEREFLKTISPYHNLKAGLNYPKIFFITSTKDDRVHPGHARKMALLIEENNFPFNYYENIDGGHAASANFKETAKRIALQYVFLYKNIMQSDQSYQPDKKNK